VSDANFGKRSYRISKKNGSSVIETTETPGTIVTGRRRPFDVPKTCTTPATNARPCARICAYAGTIFVIIVARRWFRTPRLGRSRGFLLHSPKFAAAARVFHRTIDTLVLTGHSACKTVTVVGRTAECRRIANVLVEHNARRIFCTLS